MNASERVNALMMIAELPHIDIPEKCARPRDVWRCVQTCSVATPPEGLDSLCRLSGYI